MKLIYFERSKLFLHNLTKVSKDFEEANTGIDEEVQKDFSKSFGDALISFATDWRGKFIFAEFVKDHPEIASDILKDRFHELEGTDHGIDSLKQLIMAQIPILEARLCFNLKQKDIWEYLKI